MYSVRAALRPLKHRAQWHADLLAARLAGIAAPADIAFFHQFAPPPAGGGHQFLRALWRALRAAGWRLENNTISRTTRACLCNGHNFDVARLRALRRGGLRIVHRVDGPVEVYRGRNDGTDQRIWQANRELAQATVFQSHYSLHKHRELGLEFHAPVIIMNTPDPLIFHRQGRVPFSTNRKIRLISTSWSANPNKGADVYRWLAEHLDHSRFRYTFVGRVAQPLPGVNMLPPMPSAQLATLLRQHDIVITASRHDPCSNALLEALACGLPALFLQSGGHPELVGTAGFGFQAAEELPALLDALVADYAARQAAIRIPAMETVAHRYLSVLGLADD